jgi:twitching motility protein PilT
MFEKLEELAKNNSKISDFHLRAGSFMAYRQTGEIIMVKDVDIKEQDLQDLIAMNCNEKEIEKFKNTHELDTSVMLSGLRFRANFYKTIHGAAAVLRRVESKIPDMHDFNLPQPLFDIIGMHKGLVLITGPTGSGKSTTLAAIVNEINKTRTSNIITVEDPVEFIHKRCSSNYQSNHRCFSSRSTRANTSTAFHFFKNGCYPAIAKNKRWSRTSRCF